MKITFVQADGSRRTVNLKAQGTLMTAAVNHSVPGIEAKCKGSCSCVTCHVWVGQEWVDRLAAASEMEMSTLDFADDRRETSRLSCQIDLEEELDGLTVFVPEDQRVMGLY